eukprot:737355-Rhodomonas_salina.2
MQPPKPACIDGVVLGTSNPLFPLNCEQRTAGHGFIRQQDASPEEEVFTPCLRVRFELIP